MKKWILKFASYKSPDDIFNAVVSGTKSIETRQRNIGGKVDYSNIKSGDILICKSLDSGKVVEKEVAFVHLYNSVFDMVQREDVEKIYPGIGSKENLMNVFEDWKKKWGKSYAEKLDKYGIVAIGMK